MWKSPKETQGLPVGRHARGDSHSQAINQRFLTGGILIPRIYCILVYVNIFRSYSEGFSRRPASKRPLKYGICLRTQV